MTKKNFTGTKNLNNHPNKLLHLLRLWLKSSLRSALLATIFTLCILKTSAQQLPWYIVSSNGEPWASNCNINAMNEVYGKKGWNHGQFNTVKVSDVFSPDVCFVFLEGSNNGVNELVTFLSKNQVAIEFWVNQGGKLLLNVAPPQGGNVSLGFDSTIVVNGNFQRNSNSVISHPIFNGPYMPVTNTWAATPFAFGAITGKNLTELIKGSGYTSLAEKAWGRGTVLFGTMVTTDYHIPSIESRNLRTNIISYLSTCTPKGGFNNTGITALVAPGKFCNGAKDIKVKVSNNGINKLDSLRVNWTLNGIPQSTIYVSGPLDTFRGRNPNDTVITLGTYTFPAGVNTRIKAWANYPNGASDTVHKDDTLNIRIKPSLSGTFTIGGSNPDYATFNEAVADLKAFGVCGPVVFNVRAGTYTERVELTPVNGVSSTNTISFVGAGKTSTILTYSAASYYEWATLCLRGIDYTSFRDMTIEATNRDYAVGVMLSEKADYNNFDNLNITIKTNSINTYGILVTNVTNNTRIGDITGNYNTFDSVKVSGSFIGAWVMGQGTTTGGYCLGNKITNSEFTDQEAMAVYFYYAGRIVVTNNLIHNLRGASGVALNCWYVNADVIANNTLRTSYVPLQLAFFNQYNYENVRSKVFNNTAYSSGDVSTYLYNCYQTDIYHNTFLGNTTTQGAVTYNTGNNVDMRNNIIVNMQNTSTSYAMVIIKASFSNLNYNCYFTNGSNLILNDVVTYANLNLWKTAYSSYNLNSVSALPKFLTAPDLHLQVTNTPPLTGEDLGIAYDIDNEPRCKYSPTLGADESKFNYPQPTANIGILDSAFEGSLTRLINTYTTAYGEKVAINWYVDGVFVADTKDLDYTFPTAGNYVVSLNVENCSSADKVSKTIQVFTPTSAPVTDFIASTTNTNLFDAVYLRDISKHGATSWQWTVTPTDGATLTGETSPNPEVMFYLPGFYDVCLTTANNAGNGTTLCKRNYISVRDDRAMCDGTTVSTSATGRLTDDGGPVKPYAPGRNCSLLINTCGQINLTFQSFNLADAQDEIRIYNGADNRAPLLGRFPGGPSAVIPGGSAGLTATNGKMFIEWVTSPASESAGFEAHWVTIPDTSFKAPVADFVVPSTVYTSNTALFQSSSQGKNLYYEWDFNPPKKTPGTEGGKKEFDRYRWNTAGTYEVKLKTTNCAGSSETRKQIVVSDPTAAPTVNFYADKIRVPVLSRLQLFDSSSQGPTQWHWEISGGTVRFITPDTVQNPVVYFTAPGFYDVKLVATNSFGSDSLVKTTYIEAFSNCIPAVGVVNTDIGISRVQFGNIDNYTSSGINSYSNYFEIFEPYEVIKRTSFTVRLERATIIDSMSRKIWIDWNGDADFDDTGEEVAYEATTTTKSFTANIQVPDLTYSGTTVMRIGAGYGSNNSPCGINASGEFEDYPLIVKNDYTAPVINLNGSDTVYVEQWYSYQENGATAFDAVDSNLTSGIILSNNVDSTQTGTYYVRYNVSDKEGNNAGEKVRVVIVTPDVTAPAITLNGSNPDKVTVNTTYLDSGAIATDYFNHDITTSLSRTDNIINTVPGSYFAYYTVDDGSGNKDSIARVVNVVDDVKPVITLNDDDTLYIEAGNAYNEPGFITSDNYWSSSAINISIDSSAININKTGIYAVIYTATDGSNNTQTVTRWIIVRDLTLPVLSLDGDDTLYLDVYDPYFEQGVTVSDNYCTNGSWKVDNKPNTKILGDYLLTYTAQDCEGNRADSIIRVVKVVDREAPIIKLKGSHTLKIQRWSNYVDSGFTIKDNYYSEADLIPLVKSTSTLDMLDEGVYSICYEVTDPSGNTSVEVCRIINVIENTTGIANASFDEEIRVYPNPNEGKFIIGLHSGFTAQTRVSITDMLGKNVYTVPTESQGNSASADIAHLPAGIYFVHVKQGERSATVKISVIH